MNDRSDDPLPPVRAVLADDERLMREQLRARLTEAWPELQIVAEARHGAEAVEMVREHRRAIELQQVQKAEAVTMTPKKVFLKRTRSGSCRWE